MGYQKKVIQSNKPRETKGPVLLFELHREKKRSAKMTSRGKLGDEIKSLISAAGGGLLADLTKDRQEGFG